MVVMKSADRCQVIIIDGLDGEVVAVASRVLPQCRPIRCENVYQAAALMGKNAGCPAVIIAPLQKLTAEKMRFFELAAQRPDTLCCCLLRTETIDIPIQMSGSSVFLVPCINSLSQVLRDKVLPIIEKLEMKHTAKDELSGPEQQQSLKSLAILSSEEFQALVGK
jgi:hypothetical protein